MLGNMKIFWMACIVILVAGVANAADTALSKKQLEKLLIGHAAHFTDGSRAIYNTNGSYRFVHGNSSSRGEYAIGNGNVCVQFRNSSRCDRYVKSGNGYVLINQGGRRFSVTIK
jgi:hypothetical protein